MAKKFKPCGPNAKRNPQTNRCRKIRNKKGNREKSIPMVPSVIPPVIIKKEIDEEIRTKKCKKIARRKKEKTLPKKVEVKREKLPFVPKKPKPISFKASFKEKKDELGRYCVITQEDAKEFGLLFGVTEQIFKDVKNKRKADYCKIFTDFFPSSCLPDGWKLTRVLGKGLSGFVLGSVSPTGERGAFKVTMDETYNSIVAEMEMGKIFNKNSLAPEIKRYCRYTPPGTDQKLHILHMGRIDSTVGQYLSKIRTKKEIDHLVDKIFEAIEAIADAGLTHGDLHGDNIGFIEDCNGVGSISLIDFGLSSNKISLPELDAIQAIRQNFYMERKERPTRNKKLFEKAIKREAKKRYGFDFKNIDYIEERFEKLRDELEATLK